MCPIRYKNSFEVDFQIEEDILDGCIVKLVLQPLLENAIYYGMEFMDGEGEIHVRGYRRDKDIYLEVEDNGLGMPEEEAAELLNGKERPHKHGSGVGLINDDKTIGIIICARNNQFIIEYCSVPILSLRIKASMEALFSPLKSFTSI